MFHNVFIEVPKQQDVFYQVKQATPAFQLTCHEICMSLKKEKPPQMMKGIASNKYELQTRF